MSEEKEIILKFRKSDLWKFGTVLFAVLFVVSLFTGIFSLNSWNDSEDKDNIADSQANNPSEETQIQESVKVQIDKTDPVSGDKEAEINIVEFSDFECPFCGRAHTGALAELKKSDYFKNGEVNLVYKHFPLNTIHPNAQKAAEAAECANRQGKFWQYHDVLFLNQKSLDVNNLKSYASQIGLETGRFNKCLDSGEAAEKVKKDLSSGISAGVRGTPHFILINKEGKIQTISGAVPWENFDAVIKSMLI